MTRVICLLIAVFLIGNSFSPVYAQRTNIYTEPDNLFKNAHDLFSKQKFALAQQQFEQYLKQKPLNALNVSDANYYVSICAIELFNEDAEDLIKNFIRDYSESPKIKMAYFNLGNFLYRKKKYKECIEYFEKSDTYQLTSEQLSEYYFKLGYSYFDQLDFEKAKLNFTEIKDKENRYQSPAQYYFSHIAYIQKNYTTALNGFLSLTNSPQFSHIVPYYIAQLYYLQNSYEQVIAYAPALLDSANTKRAPEIARILGESFYKTNRFKESIPYFIMYKEKGGMFNRNDAYQLGYAHYKCNEYHKAIDFFKGVIEIKDSLTQITLYNLGECYIKINKKEYARGSFNSCSKMDYDEILKEDAFFNYAKLAYELDYNPFDHAIIAFEAYLNQYPDSKRKDEAYKYLLNVYLTTRNYAAALESIEKIKQVTEDLKFAYQRIAFNRGVELYSNQDYTACIDLFNKSLRHIMDKPMAANAVYWKGEANFKLNAFNEAINQYKMFIYQPGAVLTSYFNTVNYNIGYAYYLQKDYTNAVLWFRKYTGYHKENDKKRLNDAFLRIADSYFITKDYRGAFDFYGEAASLKILETDYALLQRSIAAGLLAKNEDKEKGLKLLLSEYPNSVYKSDAYYELGKFYLSTGSSDEAVVYFDKLIGEYPNSSYLKQALLSKGLVYKNASKDELALNTFKQIIQDYPGTNEAKDAVNQVKLILLDDGKVDDWENFAKAQNISNLSISELDSFSFETANKKYSNADWIGASEALGNYIKKYPEGIFVIQATYYKAECDYKLNRLDEALSGYSSFLKWNKNKYTEASLLKASFLAMKKTKYDDAIQYYLQLEKVADIKTNVADARIGLMRSYKLTNQYPELKEYSSKVLFAEKTTPEIELEARYNLAKSSLMLNDTTVAMTEFSDLADKTRAEIGADARYQLAELLFKKGKINESEKHVYTIINHDPSYDLWVAKSFILLSDILVSKNDLFQAKHTLQSIIDNYEGADLVEIARKKIDTILDMEKKLEQKKVKEQIEINILPEKGSDEKLFEEEPKTEPVKDEEVKYE
jgi:TolA-binding protein